jgi:hypothetical protein
MNLNPVKLLSVLTLIATVATADESSRPPAQTPASTSGSPSVACLYTSSLIRLARRPQKTAFDVHYTRENNRIEILELNGKTGEIWEQDRAGQISYQKVFLKHNRVIDYVPGDLRALHTYPVWGQVGSLIPTSWLDHELQLTGTEETQYGTAEQYSGQIAGVDIEVLWLPALQIPARVRQVSPQTVRTLELSGQCVPGEETWTPINLDQFEHMDYADLGDNESDPFVQRYLAENEHHHDH